MFGGLANDVFDTLDPTGLTDTTKKANKTESAKLKAVLAELEKAKVASRLSFGEAQRTAGKSLPLVQGAFQGARANLGASAGATARRLAENQPGRAAGASAAVGAGGWGNSSVAALADRGVRADTARALADLDRMYAEAFGDLALGEANAVAGANAGLAALQASEGANLAQLFESAAQAIGSKQTLQNPGLMGQLQGIASIVQSVKGIASAGAG